MQTLSGMEALDVPKDRLTSLCLVLELAMLDQLIPGTQKLSATNVERSGARGGIGRNKGVSRRFEVGYYGCGAGVERVCAQSGGSDIGRSDCLVDFRLLRYVDRKST